MEQDDCGLSLINDPLRDLFSSAVFLQKKIKRPILIDGICTGQWFYKTVSYKAVLVLA